MFTSKLQMHYCVIQWTPTIHRGQGLGRPAYSKKKKKTKCMNDLIAPQKILLKTLINLQM